MLFGDTRWLHLRAYLRKSNAATYATKKKAHTIEVEPGTLWIPLQLKGVVGRLGCSLVPSAVGKAVRGMASAEGPNYEYIASPYIQKRTLFEKFKLVYDDLLNRTTFPFHQAL